jgi:hypothetical protein
VLTTDTAYARLRGIPRPEVAAKLRMRAASRYASNLPHLTENQLQYIAGFLDADGYIGSRKTRPFSITEIVQVALYNTERVVLEQIREWLGFGVVAERVNYPSHFGKKPMYIWRCQTTVLSTDLLTLLSPYLRVKHLQVEQILKTKVKQSLMSYAFISGFFDGEGAVIAYRNKKYANHEHYVLTIGQKERMVLDEIQAFIGCGSVYARTDCHILKVSDHEVQARFISNILPFSIVKRTKLEEARRFIDDKNWNIDKPLRNRHVTSGEIALRYAEGVSAHALAREYGVSQPAIHARLKRFGAPIRPLGTNQYSPKGAQL